MVWICPWCSHKKKKKKNPHNQHWNTWPNLKQISHWLQPHGPRVKGSAVLPVKSVAKSYWGQWERVGYCAKLASGHWEKYWPHQCQWDFCHLPRRRTKIACVSLAKLEPNNYCPSSFLHGFCQHWFLVTFFRILFLLTKMFLSARVTSNFYLFCVCAFILFSKYFLVSFITQLLFSTSPTPTTEILESCR